MDGEEEAADWAEDEKCEEEEEEEDADGEDEM